MRTQFLPFHLPDIGEEEIQSVVETLRSGWVTTGPKTRQFEDEFARYIGAKHAVAVNSCTAALHLALEAIGVKEGDEVIVPVMTFAASAEVVLYFKAKPVLVDCRPDTLLIDLDAVKRAITPKTKAVMPVHFAGQPCEMGPLMDLCRSRGIKVIEDAAHSLPAKEGTRRIGTIGDITCFSFYATKTVTTGEGGMAVTDNPRWADRMRMMSLHGISKDAWKRYTSEGSWRYEILSPGYKYNLTDIAASLGIEQLKKCDRMWESRRRIAARYDEAFRGLPGIRIPTCRPGVQHSWHLYVIHVEKRDAFIDELKARNIGSSVHFIPLHLHPYYRDTLGCRREDFPQASEAFDRILSLPIYPKMSDADVEDVITAAREIAR